MIVQTIRMLMNHSLKPLPVMVLVDLSLPCSAELEEEFIPKQQMSEPILWARFNPVSPKIALKTLQLLLITSETMWVMSQV